MACEDASCVLSTGGEETVFAGCSICAGHLVVDGIAMNGIGDSVLCLVCTVMPDCHTGMLHEQCVVIVNVSIDTSA